MVNHAEFGLLDVCVQNPEATDEDRHLGGGQGQQVRPVDQQVLRPELVSLGEVVAEPVCGRLEHREGLHVGLLLRRVRASRR